jgi:hypothetical protein
MFRGQNLELNERPSREEQNATAYDYPGKKSKCICRVNLLRDPGIDSI